MSLLSWLIHLPKRKQAAASPLISGSNHHHHRRHCVEGREAAIGHVTQSNRASGSHNNSVSDTSAATADSTDLFHFEFDVHWTELHRLSSPQSPAIFLLSKIIMKIDGGLKTDTRWVTLPRIHRLYWMFFWETNPFTATPGNHLRHFKGRYFRGKRRFFVTVQRSIFVLSKTTETLKIQVWEQAQDLH